MAPHTGDRDDIPVTLKAGVHRPQHIICIKDVHILVHQNDVFQLREGTECQQCGLPLLALVGVDRLSTLQNSHILAAACTVGIDIEHLAGQSLVDQVQDAGFSRDASHVDVLLAGADAGLHDGVFPVGDGLDLEQPALMTGVAVVTGELRHCIAGMAVPILDHMVAAGHDLALDDIFRIGNGVFFHGQAGAQLYRTFAQRTGDTQFVEAQRCRGRLKAGSHLDGRVHTDGNADGQRPTQFGGTLCHGTNVTAARLQKDGKFVFGLDAHPVDGHVRKASVRVSGIAHPQRDIRARIHRGIGRCRHQLEQVKIRIRSFVYHFLAGSWFVRHHRLDGRFGALTEQMTQFFLFHTKQICHPLAAGQNADGNTGVRVTLDVVEHHGRTVHFGGSHDRAACAHIAVHARKFCFRVHHHICFHQLPRCLAQYFQCHAQIQYFRSMIHIHYLLSAFVAPKSPACQRGSEIFLPQIFRG